ncbi:MAG TPA: twin-arginine translocation pathway signal protein [Alphaproteobacteria bacterium]|nr:twin-arginine translocation pathway signal protein [Alphaproteobacteria bacterium]
MSTPHYKHARTTPEGLGTPTRRLFLQVTALGTAGFLIGCGDSTKPAGTDTAASQALNAFVAVNADNTITVLNKHIEFGQGTTTGFVTIVAEEMNAAWTQMRYGFAPADAKLYGNALLGGSQGTGGSTAMADSYEKYRAAGAAARAMLIAAAAKRFGVEAATLKIVDGVVQTADGTKSARFGELAADAAKVPAPATANLTFKDPANYVYVGKRVPRVDTAAKTNGSAKFGMDYTTEGLLTALLQRPPKFGATVKSFDATEAKKVAGVMDVVQTPHGVAVVAKDMWAAIKGREALKVEWDESKAETRGSAELWTEYNTLANNIGTVVRKEGKGTDTLPRDKSILSAQYEFPFLAHAPLESMNCAVVLKSDGCDIYSGSQFPTADQATAAAIAGLKPEQVRIHSMLAGGSFGRRITPTADIIQEAMQVAKAIQGRAPVKFVQTREDNMRAGWYRPMALHRMTAGLDAKGALNSWSNRIVVQSILAGTPFLPPGQVDFTAVEGSATLPYAIPNMQVDLHTPKLGIPVLWWRAVGHTHTAFATEVFLDEIAAAMRQDPVALRRNLLEKHPRHLGVLNLAAEKAGWGTPLPKGRARGVAVHESFKSFVAQVAEVTVAGDGSFTVDRVVCAVDCGLAVNPDVIAAQMEGGIAYGLSAALGEAITLSAGAVDQSNFTDYTILRNTQMPKVEVHILPSAEKPTGVGEPGTPVIAPAVANAIFAATGKPVRKLPMGTKVPV